jgi:hypothetical protein
MSPHDVVVAVLRVPNIFEGVAVRARRDADAANSNEPPSFDMFVVHSHVNAHLC